MNPEQKIKIVIAEDQMILLDTLADSLYRESNMEVVGLAQNGKQALTLIKEKKPDLVVLDVEMPVMTGIELTKILKKDHPEIKILVLSFHKKVGYIKDLIKMGINGYILKERGKAELVTAINTIMNGENFLGNTVAKVLMEDMSGKKPPTEKALLSPREKQTLILVAKGYSTTQISKKLSISEFTVNTYRKNIREKLNLKGPANYLKYALKHGYISLDELDDGSADS